MAKVILPYSLQDGQKAYAAKLMADLQVLADKLNNVAVSGLGAPDVESALNQLKILIDREKAADAKVVSSLTYDDSAQELVLSCRDGSSYRLAVAEFLPALRGAEGADISVTVNDGRISAALAPGGVAFSRLDSALQSRIEAKVAAGEPGNAADILFSDGDSFQDKLAGGQLRGSDGVSAALDGIYYFRVDQGDGHLYVGVADGGSPPPLSINDSGRLIYTID